MVELGGPAENIDERNAKRFAYLIGHIRDPLWLTLDDP